MGVSEDIESKLSIDGSVGQQLIQGLEKLSSLMDKVVQSTDKMSVSMNKFDSTSSKTGSSEEARYKNLDTLSQNRIKKLELENKAKEQDIKLSREQTKQIEALSKSDSRKALNNLRNSTANYKNTRASHFKWQEENPYANSIRFSDKYYTARGMSGAGNVLKSTNTLGGRISGGILDTAAAGIFNPRGYVSTGITELLKGIKDLGDAAITAYGSIEKLKIQMSVVYGSDTEANSAFEGIKNYAVKSPFGIEQTAEMSVLLKQSGVYASDVLDTMKMIGDVSSGNNEKMKRIANNYAQIEATGRATMLDMRQFAYAGIPIYKEVADQLGVSQQTLRSMISDGKVTKDIMEQVFKNMTSAGGMFYNAVERGSKTIEARKQNLSDIKTIAASGVGEYALNIGNTNGTGGLYEKYIGFSEDVYKGVSNAMESLNISKNVEQIAENKNQQEYVKELILYAKASGNKSAVSVLEKELKDLETVFSPDKQRGIYNSSYQDKTRYNKNLDEAQTAYYNMGRYEKERAQYKSLLDNPWNIDSRVRDETLKSARKNVEYYDELIANAKKVGGVTGFVTSKQAKEYTQAETRGNYEAISLNYQNIGLENAQKRIDATNSGASLIEKAAAAEKNTDEYKLKVQKEEIQRYKALQSFTSEIQKYASETADGLNKVDFSKLSLSEFFKLLESGILEPIEKFDLVKDKYDGIIKNESDWNNNVSGLVTNMNSLASQINNLGSAPAGSGGNAVTSKFGSMMSAVNNAKTSDAKADMANRYVKDISETISKGLESKDPEAVKWYQQFDSIFKQMLIKSSLNADSLKYSADLLAGAGEKIEPLIEPLWKRIFSSGTGIDTKMFTNMADSMNAWAKMNSRTTSGAGLSAAVSDIGIQKMIREYIKPNLGERISLERGGTSMQLDFGKLESQMLQEVMSGSASKEMADALINGYKTTIKNIDQLAVAGFTTGESAANSSNISETLKNAYSGISGDKNVSATLKNGDKVSVYWDNIKSSFVNAETGAKVADDSISDIADVFENMYKLLDNYHNKIKEDLNKADLGSVLINYTSDMKSKLRESQQSYTKSLADSVSIGILSREADNLGLKGAAKNTYVDNGSANTSSYASDYINKLAAQAEEAQRKGTVLNTEQQAAIDFKNGVMNFQTAVEYIKQLFENISIDGFLGEQTAESEKLKNDALALSAGSKAASTSELSNIGLVGSAGRNFGEGLTGLTGTNSLAEQAIFKGAEVTDSMRANYAQSFAMNTDADKVKDITGFDKETLLSEDVDTDTLNSAAESFMEMEAASASIASNMSNLGKSTSSLVKNLASSAITTTFESIGENLVAGSDALNGIGDKMRELGKAALSNLGSLFVQAGLSIIAANPFNWGAIGMGLGLIAAGGMASLMSGLMTDSEDSSSESEDETQKLNDIKDQLADLLAQAREDAIYYENELRHKKAISTTESLSSTSVNDAIIAPNGNVITTHPDDYLIATKDPGSTLGGVQSASPNINMKIINESGTQMTVTQKQTNNLGSIDFVAIIKNVAKDVIASSEGDEAFAARQGRLSGRSVSM